MTTTTPPPANPEAPPAKRGVRAALTRESHFEFVGRSKLWLALALGLVALSLLAVAVRGLNFGIDFTGGTAFLVTGAAEGTSVDELREAVAGAGVDEAVVQLSEGDQGLGALVTTRSIEDVGGDAQNQVVTALANAASTGEENVQVSAVGPRWGEQISRQALEGLAVFLLLVVLYISLRFEWRMAVAALAALLHDIIITIGVYALVGFQVTPASVIALLTILGYSLYDTVVVFDRLRENTGGLGSNAKTTYGQVANTSLNQVLIRSLSTSITSLLPVGCLLFIGASLLGADTLRDLALALFIGMAIGTYSSVVVAVPFLVWLKEKEPKWAQLRARLESSGAVGAPPTVATAGAAAEAPVTPSAPQEASGATRAGAAVDERVTGTVGAGTSPTGAAQPPRPPRRRGSSSRAQRKKH